MTALRLTELICDNANCGDAFTEQGSKKFVRELAGRRGWIITATKEFCSPQCKNEG